MDFLYRTKQSSSLPSPPTTMLNIAEMSFTSVSSNQEQELESSSSPLSSPFPAEPRIRKRNRLFQRIPYQINPSSCVIVTGDGDVDDDGGGGPSPTATTSRNECCSRLRDDDDSDGRCYSNDSYREDVAKSALNFHRTWERCRCRWLNSQIVFVTLFLLLLITLSPVGLAKGEISCPPYQQVPYCSCFVLDQVSELTIILIKLFI